MSEESDASEGTKKSTRAQSSGGRKRSGTTSSGASRSGTTEKAGTREGAKRAAPKAAARPRPRTSEVAARAAAELVELTGKEAEGVVGLQRGDDGWTVEVEVVEVRRIPNTTDVLALYEVQTDDQGALEGYRRVRRFARGVPRED